VLGGLLRPAAGSQVAFHGQPVDGPPNGVVFVFQNYAASLLPWRTVGKNVALGLEGRLAAERLQTQVTEALETVGLADRARDYPWQLSGGMQQRVQLARALAMRPRGMLMDEPFGSLDAMTKASLQDQLQVVHQRTGATIVFVTHDIDEAVYLSDRILVLDGTPATVTHDMRVDLPRPRHQLATKELPEFLRCAGRCTTPSSEPDEYGGRRPAARQPVRAAHDVLAAGRVGDGGTRRLAAAHHAAAALSGGCPGRRPPAVRDAGGGPAAHAAGDAARLAAGRRDRRGPGAVPGPVAAGLALVDGQPGDAPGGAPDHVGADGAARVRVLRFAPSSRSSSTPVPGRCW
jgi:NitT/TauT family transport system ATP-binding protein